MVLFLVIAATLQHTKAMQERRISEFYTEPILRLFRVWAEALVIAIPVQDVNDLIHRTVPTTVIGGNQATGLAGLATGDR